MILNNYRGMQWVRDHVDDEVTPEGVKHLHEILTVGTLDDPKDAGRLQQPSEERVIVGAAGRDLVLHGPPAADELPERLQAVCDFANGAGSGWMPRTLRAILCHFQMGYDHYFVDGNGRTARALFYWVALREGAWLLEFVPISRILKNAPAQYGEAYLKTETDEGDTTYFAPHQARVLYRGLTELDEYLARKLADAARVKAALPALALNHRERALVDGLLKDPMLVVTAQSHATSHDVTLSTARGDLRRPAAAHGAARADRWPQATTPGELGGRGHARCAAPSTALTIDIDSTESNRRRSSHDRRRGPARRPGVSAKAGHPLSWPSGPSSTARSGR